MIVRPEARQHRIFDFLLEFKFVKPGEAGLGGEAIREMSREELAAIPLIRQRLAEARAQAADYLRGLREQHRTEFHPRVYAVVAMGFERLVWEEVEREAVSSTPLGFPPPSHPAAT
jgi:hypothetical protein